MARTTNRLIGRKSGGLLRGVLGSLYETSAAEENPDYLNPGGHDFTDASFDANTVKPFQSGGGLFGSIRANQLNNQFAFNRLSDIESANRNLEAAKALQTFSTDLARSEKEKDLSQVGAAQFDVYDRLPPTSQTLGPVGSLPYANADIARFFGAAGGSKLDAGGVAGLGPYITGQNVLGKISATPEFEQAQLNKEVGAGMIDLGGGAKYNPSTGDVLYGSAFIPRQELIQTPSGKFTIDLEGNQVPIMESKTITTQDFKPASRGKLLNTITPDEASEALNAVGGGARINPASYNPLDLENLMSGSSGVAPTGLPRASQGAIIEPEVLPPLEREPAAASGKAPIAPNVDSYQGIIPSLISGNKAMLSGIVSGHKALIPSSISPTLFNVQTPSVLTNVPNILGNTRKALIRKSSESLDPVQNPLDLYLGGIQDSLELGGDVARGAIETVVEPLREILEGAGYYINPNQVTTEPLKEPKARLQNRLQRKAFNLTGDGSAYTPPIEVLDPMSIKGYRKKLRY